MNKMNCFMDGKEKIDGGSKDNVSIPCSVTAPC